MKRTVSAEAKRQLHDTLIGIEGVHIADTFALSRAIDALSAWYEAQNTFTDLVMDGQEAQKVCPMCGLTNVYYKLTLKRRYLDAMGILYIAQRDLTFKEIAQRSARTKPETYYRYFTEARHWGFIEATDEVRDRAVAYRLTSRGAGFLMASFAAPAWLWKKRGTDEVLDTPPDGMPVPSVFIHEISQDVADVINDRTRYMQEAVAQTSIPLNV